MLSKTGGVDNKQWIHMFRLGKCLLCAKARPKRPEPSNQQTAMRAPGWPSRRSLSQEAASSVDAGPIQTGTVLCSEGDCCATGTFENQ